MKLDVGCGYRKKEGFTGLDSEPKCKPDILWDMTKMPYPVKANTVEVLHCSHALENAISSRGDLIRIIKEWHRISKQNSKWIITLPHWTRFSTIEHVIGFGPNWVKNFSKDFEYSPDHYLNMDLLLESVRYNWRRTDFLRGAGMLLKLIRWFWNPVINANMHLTEELLCYKFGGIQEWTFVIKVKSRERNLSLLDTSGI